jgi:hypothetical protein
LTKRGFLRSVLATVFALVGGTRGALPQRAVNEGQKFQKQFFDEKFGSGHSQMPPMSFDPNKFPFQVITVSGADAVTEYEKLRAVGKTMPAIMGSDDDIILAMELWQDGRAPDAANNLADADALGESFDIKAYRREELELLRQNPAVGGLDIDVEEEMVLPAEGEWPDNPMRMQITVHEDVLASKPLPKVHIVLFPTKDSTEIPAYLGWGGWNSNPPAEVHVAMLRKWKRQYGAELVAISGDVMNLRVQRRPQSRDDAMKLAQDMYYYCSDIVDQGTGDLESLAASLLVSDCWYFWWD